MKVLVKTANLERKEWLDWRTKGIGGSDVSVIAGINPYKSVYQLWLEKQARLKRSRRKTSTRTLVPYWSRLSRRSLWKGQA